MVYYYAVCVLIIILTWFVVSSKATNIIFYKLAHIIPLVFYFHSFWIEFLSCTGVLFQAPLHTE